MKESEAILLDERLENWSRWFNESDSGGGGGCCGSAEGRYVAPRVDEEKVMNRYVDVIDVADAQQIHQALLAMPLKPNRQFIYAWYAHQYPPASIARQLGIRHLNQLEAFRQRNLVMLSIELVKLELSAVQLIRRGKPIWAGVAKVESTAYKASIAVASSGLTGCRDQPHGWSRTPESPEAKKTKPA